jgi:hypothetical protein
MNLLLIYIKSVNPREIGIDIVNISEINKGRTTRSVSGVSSPDLTFSTSLIISFGTKITMNTKLVMR